MQSGCYWSVTYSLPRMVMRFMSSSFSLFSQKVHVYKAIGWVKNASYSWRRTFTSLAATSHPLNWSSQKKTHGLGHENHVFKKQKEVVEHRSWEWEPLGSPFSPAFPFCAGPFHSFFHMQVSLRLFILVVLHFSPVVHSQINLDRHF